MSYAGSCESLAEKIRKAENQIPSEKSALGEGRIVELLFLSVVGRRLNEYISHYETLSYDTKHLHAKHTRARRGTGDEQHVHLKFTAHGEHFHLRLRRDLTTFSDKLEVRA